MKIIMEIKTCYDCQYLSHTGTFTSGGAKPCCDHPETVKLKGDNCFRRVIPYKTNLHEHTNMKYREAKKIPSWCPLKKYEIKSG